MPRSLRRAPGGLVYHVVNRANDRRTIIHEEDEFDAFCQLLGGAATHTPMRICAYSVMGNHWHLVLWPFGDGELSAYLHWLTTRHSSHCRRHKRSAGNGHIYQGRFRSFPIEASGHYYNVLKYVEANPLRAGLVTRAEEWRWSSLFERVHGRKLIADGPLELPENWVDIVNGGDRKGDLERLRMSARNGRPYGTSGWVEETTAALGLGQTLRSRGRPRISTGCVDLATPGVA